MLGFPRRLAGAVADLTVGTAIVMLHVMLAERDLQQRRRAELVQVRAQECGQARTSLRMSG